MHMAHKLKDIINQIFRKISDTAIWEFTIRIHETTLSTKRWFLNTQHYFIPQEALQINADLLFLLN